VTFILFIAMKAREFQFKLINLPNSLMRFAYSLTSKNNYVKDPALEAILKSLKDSDKYVIEANFEAWSNTIMKNTYINSYRSGTSLHIDCDQGEVPQVIMFLEDQKPDNFG
jgi:DNA-directed RNA polymerase specialized sigma24 family protein